MKVVVLGKGMMLANIILGVLDAGAEIVGVFRYEQTGMSRLKLFFDDFFKPAPEVTLINKLKLNQIRMSSANDVRFQKLLLHLNPDLIIVGTWKEKISPRTFNIPTIATVNVHPSLLPKYRGPNPYIQTILHGEKYSGVSLHIMTEELDGGPILKQTKIPILECDTSKDLRAKTVSEARKLITELINEFNEHAIIPKNQNESEASYYRNITGDEKMLDFQVQSAEEIARTVRALHPFLPTYITHKDKNFIVDPYNFMLGNTINAPAGSVVAKNPENKSLTIVCADNRVIRFNNLKLYKSRGTKRYIKKEVEIDTILKAI